MFAVNLHASHRVTSRQNLLSISRDCLPLPSNTSIGLDHKQHNIMNRPLFMYSPSAQLTWPFLRTTDTAYRASSSLTTSLSTFRLETTQTVTCSGPPFPSSPPACQWRGHAVGKPDTVYMQAMDILLLPVLLQPLQAHGRPHEIHQGQRHEGNKDICHSHGARSGGLSHIWHDSGWERPGGQDSVHCRSLHGMLCAHSVY